MSFDAWKTDCGDGWGTREPRLSRPRQVSGGMSVPAPMTRVCDTAPELLRRLALAVAGVKNRDHHPASECDESCGSCDECHRATGATICRAQCPHAAAMVREAER